jgi:Domain of unknown function (DUF5753)
VVRCPSPSARIRYGQRAACRSLVAWSGYACPDELGIAIVGRVQSGDDLVHDRAAFCREVRPSHTQRSPLAGIVAACQGGCAAAGVGHGVGPFTDWAPLLIPGLLQTMEYARSFMLDDGIAPNEVESRLTARLRRQYRLRRDDVEYTALIGEPALIGNDVIHRDQLSALEEAANRPNVTIRVVPTQNMPRLGRVGAFMALGVPPATVVHVEMARSGAFLDDEAYVAPYVRRVMRLSEVALSETMSMRRIVDVRDGMEV